jgi:hypothetical protein
VNSSLPRQLLNALWGGLKLLVLEMGRLPNWSYGAMVLLATALILAPALLR